MNAAFNDYRLIWNTAVRPGLVRKVLWSLFGLASSLLLAYVLWKGPANTGTVVATGLLGAIVLVWYWLDLVGGAVQQNTPANARLVPRLEQRSVQLVGAFWLLATLGVAVIAGLWTGHAAFWGVCGGAWLMGAGMSRVGLSSEGFGLHAAAFAMYLLPDQYTAPLKEFMLAPSGAALALLALAAVGWYGKRMLFPRRDRHFVQRASVEKGERQARDKSFALVPDNLAFARRIYASRLAGVRRASTAPGEILLHALGPSAHWSTPATILLVVGAGLLIGRVLLGMASADVQSALAFVSGAVIMPLLLLFMSGPERMTGRIRATPGEQSLLRMTPAMPEMQVHNRMLAGALFRRALIEWSLVTVGMVSVNLLAGSTWKVAFAQLAICCLALPLTTFVLRDYARSPNPGRPAVYASVVALMIAGAGMFSLSLRMASVAVPAVAIAIGIIATIAIGIWRARSMMAAPLAFPAGRLAA